MEQSGVLPMANLPVQCLEAQAVEIRQMFGANPETQNKLEPEDQEELEEAELWAAQLAAEAGEAAINAASSEIDLELTASLELDNDGGVPDEVDFVEIELLDYIKNSQELLDQAGTVEEKQTAAAEVLTGYFDSTMKTQYQLLPPGESRISAQDMAFSIDIDSVMASFQAIDPWPFELQAEVQLYAVGPFERRQIGTSKFRIDPSDQPGENNLNWGYRVSLPD